jgi:hypothetical protein
MSTQGLNSTNTPNALQHRQPSNNGDTNQFVASTLSDLNLEAKGQVCYEITRIHNLISSALMRDLLSRLAKKERL